MAKSKIPQITHDSSLKERNKSKVETELQSGKKEVFSLDQLKSGGYIRQRQKDLFTVRLRCPGGRVPLDKLEKIAAVGKKYSQRDYVHISVRQSVEIPYVHYRDFAALAKELKEVGQEIASCGPRVRVPTACAGCEYNPNGLIDVQSLCRMVDQKYFGIQCNHKFKISFSGCPIDCFRTNEMDLGFQGAVEPVWDEGSCTGCRICGYACKEGAIVNDEKTGKPLIDRNKCLYCADCIRACPASSWREGRKGLVVRVGGRHGRHPVNGSAIAVFLPEDRVGAVIENIITWYNDRGKDAGRVRIGDILRAHWRDFTNFMKPTLGEYAVKDPAMPEYNRIHTYQGGWMPPPAPGVENAKDAVDAMEKQKPAALLDLRRIICPINFVKAKLKLEELNTGDILEIIIDAGEAMANVPRSIKEEGHRVVQVTRDGNHFRLTIEKA